MKGKGEMFLLKDSDAIAGNDIAFLENVLLCKKFGK